MILNKEDAVLVVIDIQERLSKHISGISELIQKVKKLLKVWKILDLPLLLTEQEKLGDTLEEIKEILGYEIKPIRKKSFSCMKEEKFVEELRRLKPRKVVLIGIEAHICVLQTALDLVKEGYEVHVVIDAIGSRNDVDKKVAVDKMLILGIIPTTVEIVIYELLKTSTDEKFKEVLKVVKD